MEPPPSSPRPAPPRQEQGRAARRAELLAQLAELRALKARVQPRRTRLDRERAALLRTLGRL